MNYLVLIIYPILLFAFFYKSKLLRNTFNEDSDSISQTKSLLGFASVLIMLHHISQNIEYDLSNSYGQLNLLGIFTNIGYLFVALFFFYSGYGLYLSMRTKENYLQGFLSKHLIRILFPMILIEIVFFYIRHFTDLGVYLPRFFINITGPMLYNPNSWYCLILPLLYIFYVISFKKIRNTKVSLIILISLIGLYTLLANVLFYGVWLFNTVPLFFLGIIYSTRREEINSFFKRRYFVIFPISIVLAIVLSVGAVHFQSYINNLNVTKLYPILRYLLSLLQTLASVSFVVSTLLFSMKFVIGNRFLKLMGGITLEFYLIHGIWVNYFGPFYFHTQRKGPLFVNNSLLYVLAVFALSLGLSLFFKFILTKTYEFAESKKETLFVFKKDMRKVGIFFIGLIVIFLLYSIISNISLDNDSKETIDKYKTQNITMLSINDKTMSCYEVGEGEHTIIMLSTSIDPVPSITLKPIADKLSENNRVIILDLLNNGFSSDTKEERSVENVVSEITIALEQLGEEGPYIFMPFDRSALYVNYYYSVYPERVEAIVGINSYLSSLWDIDYKFSGITINDYYYQTILDAKLSSVLNSFLKSTALTRFMLPVYQPILENPRNRQYSADEILVVSEVFVDRFLNNGVSSIASMEYHNINMVRGIKYDESLPVMDILPYATRESYKRIGVSLDALHQELYTNSDIQFTNVLSGDEIIAYWNQVAIAEATQEFINNYLNNSI